LEDRYLEGVELIRYAVISEGNRNVSTDEAEFIANNISGWLTSSL